MWYVSPWIFFTISQTTVQCHTQWEGISLRRSDSRICTETDERAIWPTRAECRSEAIVRSRKLLDIRYHAHSSSENIFRPGGKIQALSLTHAWEETKRSNAAFLENQHRCNCTYAIKCSGLRNEIRPRLHIFTCRSSFLRKINKRFVCVIFSELLQTLITREENAIVLKKYKIAFSMMRSRM